MSMLDNIANRFDSLQAMDSARIRVGAWVVVIGLLGHEPAERVRSIRPRPVSVHAWAAISLTFQLQALIRRSLANRPQLETSGSSMARRLASSSLSNMSSASRIL